MSCRFELGNPGVLLIDSNRAHFSKEGPFPTTYPSGTNSQYIWGQGSHEVGMKFLFNNFQKHALTRNTFTSFMGTNAITNKQTTLCQSKASPPPPPRKDCKEHEVPLDGRCFYLDSSGGVCQPG